jgi:tetratricopeptide repeat protein 30
MDATCTHTHITYNIYCCLLISYIPILMSQAKLYWDKENYPQVEKIFRKSVEFCSDRDEWKLNVAHVLFMQVMMPSSVSSI